MPHPPLPRTVVALYAVAATVLPSGCRADETAARPLDPATRQPTSQGPTPPVVTPARTAAGRALEVVGDWDERRAQAFAAGDPGALRRLHAAGSPLLERDLAVMRRYAERGLVVTGLRQQVVSLEVLARGETAMTVSVVERLARAVARPIAPSFATAGTTGVVPLPVSRFARRVLRFELVDGAWQLSWAREG